MTRPDPWRMQFLNTLLVQLEKLGADAMHHSKLVGVPLPGEFEGHLAKTHYDLDHYRSAVRYAAERKAAGAAEAAAEAAAEGRPEVEEVEKEMNP